MTIKSVPIPISRTVSVCTNIHTVSFQLLTSSIMWPTKH